MSSPEFPAPRTVRIATGRTVAYYELGVPTGTPVLALHGTPASGAVFAWADDAARQLGVRLVAPDRPGVGWSDPLPRGRVFVVADYVRELAATVDALGIETFPVLGYSGGGPYAVAVAHALADRVSATAVVAGAGQVGEWASIDEFEATDRRMTRWSLRAPRLAGAALSLSARIARHAPRTAARFAARQMSHSDRAVLARFSSPQATLALFTQAFLRRASGVVDDYAALGRPWGFPVADVRTPLACFHATDDPMVPIRHSEELVARVTDAILVRWPGEGHLAIVDHIGEVLAWLLGASDAAPARDDGAGRSGHASH